MRKTSLFITIVFICFNGIAQKLTAKKLLDEVSSKMGAYTNMTIDFSSKLENKDAGVTNEAPIRGNIILVGQKYNLDYLGNKFIFDGKKLIIINKEEQEVSISKGDLEEEDGFVYPSKLITFYKKGHTYKMGKLKTIAGRQIQYVELTPTNKKSNIKKFHLGIDAKTRHIYQLTQIGNNGTVTTFTIHNFKSNQTLSNTLFDFNRKKYEDQGYLID